jgi:hypothetical protein
MCSTRQTKILHFPNVNNANLKLASNAIAVQKPSCRASWFLTIHSSLIYTSAYPHLCLNSHEAKNSDIIEAALLSSCLSFSTGLWTGNKQFDEVFISHETVYAQAPCMLCSHNPVQFTPCSQPNTLDRNLAGVYRIKPRV